MTCSDFTILIAEDDLNLLDVYDKSLSPEGYRLILVKSCERALAELYEKETNLLIADLKMEEMQGFEMFELLKKNHPKLPVIVVSGTFDGVMEDFHKKGFDNVKVYLQKPIGMDVLKRKIKEVLMPSI
jgi:DNA-binding NtrC family response regulator